MSGIQPWAGRKSKNEIYLGVDDWRDKDNPKRAELLEFTPVKLYEVDDKTHMCTISNDAATKLMDYLWKLNVRPTNQ